ncbi:trypsin-2-like [Culicoides brevitarsis]|uniref:trypsin-2-like n=1 Tax=Culicoides brevitarsis TaxID=469753 RepID=UPI00307C7492
MRSISLFFTFYVISRCSGIHQGRNASANQFPFIVSLRNQNNDHLDAGSIISHRFVLSTAWTLKFNPIRVIAGSVILLTGGISYRIVSSHIHPLYDEITFRHNIGLVKTQNFIYFTDAVRAINVGTLEMRMANVPVVAAGWGDSKEAVKSRTNLLKWANFVTIDAEKCFDGMKKASLSQFYHANLVCAVGYAEMGQQWCSYDFGGPLIAGNTLIGVLFRPGMQTCTQQDAFPNVALRVEPYLYWIHETMVDHESP